MANIKVMDARLASMIAAGEVVERPSSVLKELIENSLDASAHHITVKIYHAGRDKIIVEDDGIGMDKDDALMCFKEHASSKIKDEYDLFKIKTMGFRGEALPSIASVSKVTLETSNDGISGTEVTVIDGIKEIKVIPFHKGSRFTVEELFYNTPARLKYLKSDSTELASCIDVVSRLALSRVDVSFSFYIDDREHFVTSGRNDLLEAIGRVYSIDYCKKLIEVNYEDELISIKGYISKPEFTKSNKYQILTYINNRNVYVPSFQRAIIDGYGNYLFSSRYPITFLFFSLDSSLVDCNVHPSKREVRLSLENELSKTLETVIREALSKLNSFQEANISSLTRFKNTDFEEKSLETDNNLLNENKINQEIKIEYPKVEDFLDDFIEAPLEDSSPLETTKEVILKDDNAFAPNKDDKIIEEQKIEKGQFSYRIIGQIHKTYIVLEGDDGFYLVDQHAANERVNYEKFSKIMTSHLESRELFSPYYLTFPTSDIVKLTQEKIALLNSCGLRIEIFGSDTVKVETVPNFFKNGDIEKDIEFLIQKVIDDKNISLQELRDEVIASKACKSSIKANDYLDMNEMEFLLKELFKCQNPTTCPHGRPTIIHFSSYDIEKLFKRTGK